MGAEREIVLGTRGSDLALTQAGMVQHALTKKCGLQVRIQIIATGGDEQPNDRTSQRLIPGASLAPISHESLDSRPHDRSSSDEHSGRKGLFTAELERALLERRIDLAVHSAKDLPSEMDRALVLAAVLPRGPVEDVLILKTPASLASLPAAATIATGSIRRQRQLGWTRPDLRVLPLRGNVPTRLRKLAQNEWDGIVLARAGLERLGLSGAQFLWEGEQFFAQVLPVEPFLPAGGQGIIALQVRREAAALVSAVDEEETHRCLRAEREFLRLLQGDCDSPVGAHAQPDGPEIELSAQVFTKTREPRVARGRGREPEAVAAEVFERIGGRMEYEHE